MKALVLKILMTILRALMSHTVNFCLIFAFSLVPLIFSEVLRENFLEFSFVCFIILVVLYESILRKFYNKRAEGVRELLTEAQEEYDTIKKASK